MSTDEWHTETQEVGMLARAPGARIVMDEAKRNSLSDADLSAMAIRHTILIVEDVALQAKKLKYDLTKFGYEVVWVENGRQAIEFLIETKLEISLVISDIQMPHMDGLELLENLRRDPRFDRLPFITVTTLQDEEILARAFALQTNDFLIKPIRPQELHLRVKNLISLTWYEKLLVDESRQLTADLVRKNRLLQENHQKLQQVNGELSMLQTQLENTSKLASIGVLSSGIAHEINNPLAIMSSYNMQMAELIESGEYSPERAKNINDRVNHAIERITKIVQNLRSLATNDEAAQELEALDLRGLIVGLEEYFRDVARNKKVEVVFDLQDPYSIIQGEQTLLQQAFLNLIFNAMDAMETCETRRLTIRTRANEENVQIDFADTGCGIAPENLTRIFEPLFTTKDSDKGTGLGLALVSRFLRTCGGTIVCESEIGDKRSGTCFTVTLPLARVLGDYLEDGSAVA